MTAAGVLIGLAFFNTVIRYMEIVGLYSLYMGASDRSQPATDFTILSCAQLIVYMLGSVTSGVLADWLGYAGLFTLATAISLLGADGRLALDGEVMEEPALKTALAARLAGEAGVRVRLKADGRAEATRVVAVMELLREAGVERLKLLTVPEGG